MSNLNLPDRSLKWASRLRDTLKSNWLKLWMALTVPCLLMSVAQAQSCVSITSYGGNGNGVADNAAALAAAKLSLPTQGGCISFPAGKYRFNSAITVNYPTNIYALTLVGAGSEASALYFPASNGVYVNLQAVTGPSSVPYAQSLHISDLTFTTGQTGSYSAITLNKPGILSSFGQSDIVRTMFRGDDGAALTDYWSVGVAVLGTSNVNFDSDLFYGNSAGTGGTGILLTGCSASGSDNDYPDCTSGGSDATARPATQSSALASPKPASCTAGASQLMSPESRVTTKRLNTTAGTSCTCPVGTVSPFGISYNIAKSGFYKLSSGLTVGTLIQGVTVAQSTFAGGVNGIYVPSNAVGLTEIAVAGSTFTCTGTQILDQSLVATIIMNGDVVYVPANMSGLDITGGGGFLTSLVNNLFVGTSTTGPSGTGILVSGVTEWSQASGNVFTNLGVGIDLSGAYQWNVQANGYDPAIPTQVYNPTYPNSVGVASN